VGLFDFFKPKDITVQPSENLPVQNYTDSNFDSGFELIVEDVFTITGRGTIVTGRVTRGMVRVGEEVVILPSGIRTVVTGIEQFRKSLDYAKEGDNAGILLRGVSREQVQRGNTLNK
jgi:elongation factor Tu